MSTVTLSPAQRLEIVSLREPHSTPTFADDVRSGLSAVPKRLPSKYFYDELGSALFDAITLLPEYYLTRAETEILRDCGWEIVRALGNPVEFIELGSGSAIKTRILIEEALRVQRTLRYSPIDISTEALRSSALSLVERYSALTITAYAADYFSVLRDGALKRPGRVLAMFMGSNIGNYEPEQARELLRAVASSLKKSDGILVGMDLKKEPRVLERAYDDPTGVTAAFNKNLLARINRELDGEFDLDDFRHIATYDARSGCVRSYLQAERSHSVRIAAIDANVEFIKGERIHTESSYKFSEADIASLAAACGLKAERSWTDARKRFSVTLFVRTD